MLRSSLFALMFVTLGCGRGSAPPPGSELLGATKAIADQMCACKDKACARALRPAWEQLTKGIGGVSFTPEQVDALAREDQRFFKCMMALHGAP